MIDQRDISMRQSAGISIIEVLVVIAIIALLVAILLPSLEEARENARVHVCQSHEKQLVAAMAVYASANLSEAPEGPSHRQVCGQYFTVFGERAGQWMKYGGWYGMGLLWTGKYIDDAHLFYCPTSKGTTYYTHDSRGWNRSGGKQPSNASGGTYFKSHYFYRYAMASYPPVGATSYVKKGAEIKGMAKVCNLSDPDWRYRASYLYKAEINYLVSTSPAVLWDGYNSSVGDGDHHRRGYNIAYYDGSTRFMVATTKYYVPTHGGYKAWTGFPVNQDWDGAIAGSTASHLAFQNWADAVKRVD